MGKQQFTLRIDEEIFKKMKEIAEKEKRSLNGQYEYFLEKCIEDYEIKNTHDKKRYKESEIS